MLYTLENLNLDEIKLIRQSLNIIQITGNSAQFVASLQNKLDNEISQIENFIQSETIEMSEEFKKIEKSIKGK
jgi:gas vesicle protein